MLTNAHDVLTGYPVKSLNAWLVSTVALHWIRDASEYKQFVGNRVRKIKEKESVIWRHVPTQENPAELGSRGGPVNKDNVLWWEGPNWLKHPASWPPDIVTTANPEYEAEVKATKQVFALAVNGTESDVFDELLSNGSLWHCLRVGAWVQKFINNTRNSEHKRKTGALITEEINYQKLLWEKKTQKKCAGLEQFEDDKLKLNLQMNHDGALEFRGRIQGDYPVYLPDSEMYTEKLVQHAHEAALHGGVSLTMAKVRETHWVPRLRQLVKLLIKRCYGCKRFYAVAYSNPPPGNLPQDRTVGTTPFQVVGVDYAGPVKYRVSTNREGKAYIVLYACSLSRALYLELTKTMETEEFISTLKRFIARKGRPEKIYSDDGRTFVGAAKWLRNVMQDERLHDFLAKLNIKWQFNLTKAPWWGGQFERMIGLVKQAFNKSVGNGTLTWSELQDVLLEVEVALNNRPLSYVEEDVQLPVLAPNMLQFGRPNLLPEDHNQENPDLRKRARYLPKCKDVVWGRWSTEYLRSLRERHNLKHNKQTQLSLSRRDVVIIKGEEKNRGH